jgi:hypothetical protein
MNTRLTCISCSYSEWRKMLLDHMIKASPKPLIIDQGMLQLQEDRCLTPGLGYRHRYGTRRRRTKAGGTGGKEAEAPEGERQAEDGGLGASGGDTGTSGRFRR